MKTLFHDISRQPQQKYNKKGHRVTSAENNGTEKIKEWVGGAAKRANISLLWEGGYDMLRTFFLSFRVVLFRAINTTHQSGAVCDDADDCSDSLAYSSLLSAGPSSFKKKRKPCCEEMNLVYQN